MVVSKICFKCGEEKTLDDFYKHQGASGGHVNKCKECTKEMVRLNYKKNIDHYKRYEKLRCNLPHRIKARKEYEKTDNGIVSGNKSKIKWKNNNTEKRKAHLLLWVAIRSGKIIKKPCSVCGSTYRINGHHEDYSKPLEVIWLCPACHKLHHLKQKQLIKEKTNE